MVLRIEKKIQDYMLKNKQVVLLAIILAAAVIIRYIGRDFESGDMHRFLVPWFDEITQNGGIGSLSEQVGDYGLLYQTLISLMTYIPLKSVYLYKLLSMSFDFLLAYIVYIITKDMCCKGDRTSFIPAIMGGGNSPAPDNCHQFRILGPM